MVSRFPSIQKRGIVQRQSSNRQSKESFSDVSKTEVPLEIPDLATLPSIPIANIPENLGKTVVLPKHNKEIRKIENYHVNSMQIIEKQHENSEKSPIKYTEMSEKVGYFTEKRRNRRVSVMKRNAKSQKTLRSVSVVAKKGTFLSYLLDKSVSFCGKKAGELPRSSRIMGVQRSFAVGMEDKEREIEPDGLVKYTGEYHEGLRAGEGTATYRNGDTYKGSWSHGKRDGYGEYHYTRLNLLYKGEWKAGLRHGTGTLLFPNGDLVETLWTDDRCTPCKGSIEYVPPIKSLFQGDLKGAEKTGDGVLTYPSGTTYTGLWEDDKRHGSGLLRYPNDSIFEGNFTCDSASTPGLLHLKHVLALKTDFCPSSFRPNSIWSKEEKEKQLGNLDDFYYFTSHSRVEGRDIVWRTLTVKEMEGRIGRVDAAENGRFQAGFLNGCGVALYGEFGLYIGEFREGKRSGYGEMTYLNEDQECLHISETQGKYVGQWKSDMRHGKGKMTWRSGEVYEGMYRKDRRHNVQGTLTLPSGELYSGLWVHNSIQGQGRYQDSSGLLFIGKFLNSSPHTDGTLIYRNGDKYEGTVKDLKPHGRGRIVYASREVYVGDFWEGVKQGTGKMTYGDGSVYSGEWKDGVREGWGTLQNSAEVYEGSWSRDMKHGLGVLKKLSGAVVFEGLWRENVKEGRGTTHIGT